MTKHLKYRIIILKPVPLSGNKKPQLMISRTILNRVIIIGFMMLVGFCLARAVYIGSFFGIVLALTSLVAAIYFLYLLVKGREMMESEESV